MKPKHILIALPGLFLLYTALGSQLAHGQQSRIIILAGYHQEPPVSTSGSGVVTVAFHHDTLSVSGDFSDLTSPYRGAYIMVGEKGEFGNMLFRLKVNPNEDRTGGVLNAGENAFFLSDVQKPLLRKGELYINITSRNHSRGELRGQIPPMNVG